MSDSTVDFIPPKSDPIPIPNAQKDLEGYTIIPNNCFHIKPDIQLFTKHGIPIQNEPEIKFNFNPNFKFP